MCRFQVGAVSMVADFGLAESTGHIALGISEWCNVSACFSVICSNSPRFTKGLGFLANNNHPLF
jgi:hypothetical protein